MSTESMQLAVENVVSTTPPTNVVAVLREFFADRAKEGNVYDYAVWQQQNKEIIIMVKNHINDDFYQIPVTPQAATA